MKNIKKALALIAAFCVTVSFASCKDGDDKNKETENVSSVEEINAKYEESILGSGSDEYEKLTDTNPIIEEFTQVDFQFTTEESVSGSGAMENAFNVPKNGYAVLTPSGASFGYIGMDAVVVDGAYKNAKGYGFSNSAADIIASYKADLNIVATENGGIAFGFSSADGVNFSLLSTEEVTSAMSVKNSGQNVAISSGHNTVALIVLTADAGGTLSQYEIYHYSTEEEQVKHDH